MFEHYKILPHHKGVHMGIGISMFLGWFSYFYISFIDPFAVNIYPLNLIGLPLLVIGFYLFLASQKKVHKRMHERKGKLITDGVYKHLSHPMYLGEILLFWSAPILGGSLLTLSFSPVFIFQLFIWRYFEEKELMNEFPDYKEYRNRTWF
jgi:protein-S-isoprenylcysteine O-methyltransferase Ste14